MRNLTLLLLSLYLCCEMLEGICQKSHRFRCSFSTRLLRQTNAVVNPRWRRPSFAFIFLVLFTIFALALKPKYSGVALLILAESRLFSVAALLLPETPICEALVSYPDPHRSCGWITSPLHYSRSGDVIHPQLRCGSGYETSEALVSRWGVRNREFGRSCTKLFVTISTTLSNSFLARSLLLIPSIIGFTALEQKSTVFIHLLLRMRFHL